MLPPLTPPEKDPTTIDELFDFYNTYVKVLYSAVQTENALPQEVLFELNAAFDHLSRHWIYREPEADVVRKSYGHLKRSCLDIFKISVREARTQFDELRKLDTSAIDNGQFDTRLIALFSDIRKGATSARRLEGRGGGGSPGQAFDAWQPVYLACLKLESDFYHHNALDWAKRRWWGKYWKSAIASSALAGVVGWSSRSCDIAPLATSLWEATLGRL